MKINIKAFALTCGLLWGSFIFIATLWAIFFLARDNGFLIALKTFYFGYEVGYRGAIIGGFYGFLHGIVTGGLFGAIYNFFSK